VPQAGDPDSQRISSPQPESEKSVVSEVSRAPVASVDLILALEKLKKKADASLEGCDLLFNSMSGWDVVPTGNQDPDRRVALILWLCFEPSYPHS
jgi:hypothetical protein